MFLRPQKQGRCEEALGGRAKTCFAVIANLRPVLVVPGWWQGRPHRFRDLHSLNNVASWRMDFSHCRKTSHSVLSRHLCVVSSELNSTLHEQAQDVNVFMAAASDCCPLGTISADGLERIHQRLIYWQHQSMKADFLSHNIFLLNANHSSFKKRKQTNINLTDYLHLKGKQSLKNDRQLELFQCYHKNVT